MKTRAILMGLVAVLCFASCKKERTCVPPASGDTPFTVVEGMELGMPLSEALLCSQFDSIHIYSETLIEGYGMYASVPSCYTLTIDTLGDVISVVIRASFADTAVIRQNFEAFVAYNQAKYGEGKKERNITGRPTDGIDPYSLYQYTWQICDGLQITAWPLTSYMNWERDLNLIERGVPGDTLIRAAQVWYDL